MFELAMSKAGGFWDKANRKLVGDEKMDLINAKNKARTEKLDQKIEANRIAGEESKKNRAIAKEENKQNKKQADEGIYPGVSGNDLFNATMLAAANRKYSIESSDKAGLTVTFQTHKNETYWDGKLSCFILEVGSESRVAVSGSYNRGSTESGFAPGSTFSDGMRGLASQGAFVTELKKFKNEILQEVAKYPKSDPLKSEAKVASVDLPEQLAQLKKLFDSGALTAEEFEKAKAKLLG
jgi:hypothetical protein